VRELLLYVIVCCIPGATKGNDPQSDLFWVSFAIGRDANLPSFQGADGSRQPTALEIQLAETQGKCFYEAVAKVNFE
jgi:hypothetical protein